MKSKKILALPALVLGICMMGYALLQLHEMNQAYQEGNAAYDSLGTLVRQPAPANTQYLPLAAHPAGNSTDKSASGPTGTPVTGIPASGINFDTLKSVNKDAVAWLYCPNTVIDYPVMQADDYAYYLHHLPDGTVNANGSLFIDYNCAPDLSDPLTIIYGHHMKSGRMFGSLKGYKDQRYYQQHPYMYLYTQEGDYKVDLLYGCVISAGQWRERAFMYAENVDALVAYVAYHTTFDSGVGYTKGDRVVVLSTCSYEFEDARYVVLGILREAD